MTVKEFKTLGAKHLKESPSAMLDIQVFLSHFLKKDRTFILMNQDFEIPGKALEKLLNAVKKRKTGLPVSYITNSKEFFGYDFFVTEDVLIPKPDTEILVMRAIDLIKSAVNSGEKKIEILDICSGSGCIGISVLKTLQNEFKNQVEFTIYFSDISEKAIEISKTNAKRLLDSEQNIFFIKSNLFQNISKKFNFILTNPPYIPKKMALDLLKDGRNEPLIALNGDVTLSGNDSDSSDGLEIIRNLVPEAKNHLKQNGCLLIETGEYNSLETQKILKDSGFCDLKIHKDFEGQNRVNEGIKK